MQGPLAQLPWYHQIALMEKICTPAERLWYAAAVERGWSRDVLALHIETGFHQRSGKAVTAFSRTLPAPDSDLAQQATRDPYLFDLLGTTDMRVERDVETLGPPPRATLILSTASARARVEWTRCSGQQHLLLQLFSRLDVYGKAATGLNKFFRQLIQRGAGRAHRSCSREILR